MVDTAEPQSRSPEPPAAPKYTLATELTRDLPEGFKGLGMDEHLIPDDLGIFYKDDETARQLILKNLEQAYRSPKPGEVEINKGFKKWVCVSGWVRDLNRVEKKFGKNIAAEYRRWIVGELGERLETGFIEGEHGKYYPKTIVPIFSEGYDDVPEVWVFGLSEQELEVIVKGKFPGILTKTVEIKKGAGDSTEATEESFDASIGMISSDDGELVENVIANPQALRILRRLMINRRFDQEGRIEKRPSTDREAWIDARTRQIIRADVDLQKTITDARSEARKEWEDKAQKSIHFERGAKYRAEREKLIGVREAQQESLTDSLTGLPNRRFLLGDEGKENDESKKTGELHRIFAEAQRMHHGLTALFIDCDDFKEVNTAYGETPVGDIVLKTVGERLSVALREGDLLTRFGGEEFVALLPESEKLSADQLKKLFKRLNEAVATADLPHGIKQTISIGVASFPDGALANPMELLRRANDAEHEAKKRGKNQFVVWNRKTPRIASFQE